MADAVAVEAVAVKKGAIRPWMTAAVGLGLMLAGDVAMAATSGPFGKINTFIQSNFLPFVGSVGLAGGIGYGAIHAFKHDYGKAGVGIAAAAAGGFMVVNSPWFATKAGVTAATLGAHVPLVVMALHSVGL